MVLNMKNSANMAAILYDSEYDISATEQTAYVHEQDELYKHVPESHEAPSKTSLAHLSQLTRHGETMKNRTTMPKATTRFTSR